MQREQLVQTPLVWDMLMYYRKRANSVPRTHGRERRELERGWLYLRDATVQVGPTPRKKQQNFPGMLSAEFFLKWNLESTYKPGQLPARLAARIQFLENL